MKWGLNGIAALGVWVAAMVNAYGQVMPPSYYGLVPTLAPMSLGPDTAIEPPPGPLSVIVIEPPAPPAPPPPPPPSLLSYYVLPAPPDLTLDDDTGDLTPLIVTRIIMTRSCFRYYNRWHCHSAKVTQAW